jgi:LacI family transcriptional regulator
MGANTAPTLHDVARRAGVSTATVSRCLNLPDCVRPQTRARVEAAVAELGYTPHFGGRALVSNRTNTVGAVIPTMENAIFARGLQAMQDEFSAGGVTLLVATSYYDAKREAEQIRALLARGVDGLVLIGKARPDSTYQLLQARSIPFLLVWSYQADSPYLSVGFDNRGAAREMAEQVLANGHQRIAMICGLTSGNDRAAERVAGVRDALAAKGILLKPPYLAETPYTLDDSSEAAKTLLALDPRPTAIICGNDVQAAGALRGSREAGLAVPRDVSIVGFDDIDLAVAVEPALTTVRVPHRRMGRAAAKLLLQLIANVQSPESVCFDTRIIQRGSLSAPPNEI